MGKQTMWDGEEPDRNETRLSWLYSPQHPRGLPGMESFARVASPGTGHREVWFEARDRNALDLSSTYGHGGGFRSGSTRLDNSAACCDTMQRE